MNSTKKINVSIYCDEIKNAKLDNGPFGEKENWDYIQAHWGDTDQSVMEQIAKFKDESDIEISDLNKKLDDAKAENLKLTQQNVEVNKTNMALILRLTDPTLPPPPKEEPYEAPKPTDYDSFWK